MSSVEHLFMFRYLTIKGNKDFPLQYKVRISLTYALALAQTIQIERSYRDEHELIEEMSMVRQHLPLIVFL